MDYVFVSLQRINTDRESTSTSIAKELSKSHRVLYVNPPIDRKTWTLSTDDPFVKKHIEGIKLDHNPLKRSSNDTDLWILSPKTIIESLNWIPNTSVFSVFNKLNNKKFAGEINKALMRLSFKNCVLIIDKDIFRSFYLKEFLKPRYTIYLDRDYTLGFSYWKRHGITLEPKLISKCDAVVCNSTDFQKNNKKYNENSFYISNGANLELFSANKTWQMPKELENLQRPLIGYVGALISSRLDISLIANVANKLKAGTVVLIGPQDLDFENSELHELKNVTFIEKKDTQIVPSYLTHFDVCINPQALNEITIGNFPLKIVEYLAMGKPVVATATNTMKEVFSNHSYLATSHSEFSRQIKVALEEDNDYRRTDRITFSKKFSWQNVTQNLLTVVKKLNGN